MKRINAGLSGVFLSAIVTLVASCSPSDVAETVAGDVLNLAVHTGRFIDSPVAGLNYSTTSGLSGVTNSLGEFEYRDNDVVEFSIDNFSIGSINGASKITPFDLAGFDFRDGDNSLEDLLVYRLEAEVSGTVTNFEEGVNRLILLQSLDRNHNPDDGIDVGGAAALFAILASTLLFTQDTDKFVAAFFLIFVELIAQGALSSDRSAPVSENTALVHFIANAL